MPGPGAGEANNIRVAVRCRPFNVRELAEEGGEASSLTCASPDVKIKNGKTYSFDHVAGCDAAQEDVFAAVGERLLEDALNAYNGCIFAYGQTGSGKSFSMVGDIHNDVEKGILPRACVKLFEMLAAAKSKSESGRFEATVLATYLEIYNEKVFDLLTSDRGVASGSSELQMRYHPQVGAIVVGLTECPMATFQEAFELFDFGAKNRAVAATQMNAVSSRSHAVFTIQIRTKEATAGGSVESQAKIHFVDLAGSEKQKKTGAVGDRLKEGIGINQSLTTLGRVISELTKPGSKAVPPFRDSKLTLLLKDALMGNSRTELLACISPSEFNIDESISTLEFAARCKLVKTSAKKNEQSKVDVIAQLKDEKDIIERQLQEEKASSEELCRKLQTELASAAERQRLADEALQEKEEIERRLQQLQDQHSNEARALEEEERRKLEKEKEELLKEKNEMSKLLKERTESRQKPTLPSLGARVMVSFNKNECRATVRYAGAVPFADGDLVGVELDEEKGKNDGSVHEERYFTCQPGHGLFVRPEKVTLLEPDRPGRYNLTRRAAITDSKSIYGGDQVAELEAGTTVLVVEILRVAEEGRIRACLKEPPGWLSLVDTKTGQRWAVRDDAASNEEITSAVSELHARLAEIKAREEQQQAELRRDDELRQQLQQEVSAQVAKEKDLKAQVEALKSVQESMALDASALEAKREEQHKQRTEALSKLGMHFSGVELEEMPSAPRLVNLHPDPALEGCLVYYLPLGETKIGGSAERCRIALPGHSIGPEVCVVINDVNKKLLVRPLGGGLVRVNGGLLGEAGSELGDGDRLAIGRAHIFQVQLPMARRPSMELRLSETEFERAMNEISACTVVDPQWENGISKAMMLVKTDFGDDAAALLLAQAKRASEACEMANCALKHMPPGFTCGVTHYELSIMFDAHGVPEVCIVARRAAESAHGDFRGVGLSAGIWEVEAFWTDRLPALYEALSMSGLDGSMMSGLEDDTAWENHAWAEVGLESYRRLLQKVHMLERKLHNAQAPDASPRRAPAGSSPMKGVARFGTWLRGKTGHG
eukprot:TRINITY_DN24014_c0_g1_i1.p1 TRINITY_DN24014_c0_g1~~TRINITY_DN24014_c0_g1_i1.p1  ORF type:complete len:1058 (-),score=256.80 TRINITY_DN24014_c0_g1_i1:379-3552(-)